MDLKFILIGLNVLIIFMYKEEWLYVKKSMYIIFLFNLILFIIASILISSNEKYPKALHVLKMPLVSALIFYSLHQSFIKIYKRNPSNTFWEFGQKPTQDVVFSILVWIIGIGVPALIFIK
jgi:hypothetical protein